MASCAASLPCGHLEGAARKGIWDSLFWQKEWCTVPNRRMCFEVADVDTKPWDYGSKNFSSGNFSMGSRPAWMKRVVAWSRGREKLMIIPYISKGRSARQSTIFRVLCLKQGDNSTFFCVKQRRPRKWSPFFPLQAHNFCWFRVPSLKCVKTQTYWTIILSYWTR